MDLQGAAGRMHRCVGWWVARTANNPDGSNCAQPPAGLLQSHKQALLFNFCTIGQHYQEGGGGGERKNRNIPANLMCTVSLPYQYAEGII